MAMSTITLNGLKYEKHNNGWHLLGGQPDTPQCKIPCEIGGVPVVEISDCAFQFSSSIVKVEIPETVKYIGSHAFQGCCNLTNISVFKKNNRMPFLKRDTIRIAEYAFEGCHNLCCAELPFIQLSWGGYQFHGCWELTSLGKFGVITGGTIDNTAFMECEKLRELSFADDVFFEAATFQSCNNLETLTFVNGMNYNLHAFVDNLSQYTFICKEENNIVELAYLGANVEVF